MQTIRDRIRQLEAEATQLKLLTISDQINLDTEIRPVSATLNLKTPTYTIITRGKERFITINDR